MDLKRWNVLLDDSIQSNEPLKEDSLLHESAQEEASEEGEIEPETEIQKSTPRATSEMKEPEDDSTEELEEGRIWSPLRIARLVKRIRAIGKGRIEEVTYRLLFGFNQDNGNLMCRKKFRKEQYGCDLNCTKDYIRSLNADIMRMFNFRITDIEKTAAQIEMLQVFDKTRNKISTCVAQSSALGNCREINAETSDCFACLVDGKMNEILNIFHIFKISEEVGYPTEEVNWKVVGEEIDEVLFMITDDKKGEQQVNWKVLAKVLRIFMIGLLNAELTVVLFQLSTEKGFYGDEAMKEFLNGFEKGKLYHTLNCCKAIIKMRNERGTEDLADVVLVKNKSRTSKPLSENEESFLVKGSQFTSIMKGKHFDEFGWVFSNEVKTEKFLILDPLLMKWTEKIEVGQLNEMVEQLANLGVKVGREMEIKMGLPKGNEGTESADLGFSEEFWENFMQNFNGTFGGDTNENGAKFRAEPFRKMRISNKRKLLHICLN